MLSGGAGGRAPSSKARPRRQRPADASPAPVERHIHGLRRSVSRASAWPRRVRGESPLVLRGRAEQCRRLARGVSRGDVRDALMEMSVDYDKEAVAAEADEAEVSHP